MIGLSFILFTYFAPLSERIWMAGIPRKPVTRKGVVEATRKAGTGSSRGDSKDGWFKKRQTKVYPIKK